MSQHPQDMHCSNMLGNLSDYIDGELQGSLCAEIEEHLKTCENCRIVVNTLKKTVELYEQCNEQAEIPGDVKERLFAKLDLKDYLKT